MFAPTAIARPARSLTTAGVLAAALLTATIPFSLAMFSASDSSGAVFTATTLVPPTGVSATGGPTASLSWTPSTSGGATGYVVERAAAAAGPYSQIGTATPIDASTYLDSPPSGTYWYRLATFVGNWTSTATSPVSATVVASTSTGEVPCVAGSNVADTGGDGNGYQTNPGNACASDGVLAVDAGTGTAGRSASCTNTANDRHRYWGYALGLPATLSSIAGITVRADVGLNNNGGTSVLCVELSWDGGASWTVAKSVTLADSAITTYTFGSTSDTWGHTWTPGELATTALRVRLTDATTHPTKDYRLDFLAVTVDYVP